MRRRMYCLCAPLVLVFASVSQATEPSTVAPGSEATTERGMAAGAVEDTMQACRARIPQDATIGQRMIAEQSCWRDENDRKPLQAVPDARRI